MTPTEIVNDVLSQFDDSTSAFLSTTDIYKWMWEAFYRLSVEADIIEQEDASLTTINGTATYTVPEDFIKINLALWGGQTLIKVGLEKFQRLTGKNPSTGSSTYYKQWRNVLTLHPIPSSAKTITIIGTQRPTKITTDNASTDLYALDNIAEEYQQMVSDYILWRAYLKDDDVKAREHEKKWMDNLERAKLDAEKVKNDAEHNTVTMMDIGVDITFV